MNLNRPYTLVCNKHWIPLRFITASKALEDIFTPKYLALSIDYVMIGDGKYDFSNPISITPIEVDEWLKLPIRSFDQFVNTSHAQIRIPTVVITRSYDKIPLIEKRVNLRNVLEAFGNIDAYTGKHLSIKRASLDHVIPRSKGGKHEWGNIVPTDKEVNRKKSDLSVEEVGYKFFKKPVIPKPIPAIGNLTPLNRDAKIFLKDTQ